MRNKQNNIAKYAKKYKNLLFMILTLIFNESNTWSLKLEWQVKTSDHYKQSLLFVFKPWYGKKTCFKILKFKE
jgi:hypothetical protein